MNTETFERLLKQAVPDGKTIREIRIRTEKPVMILLESGENLLFSDGTCGKTESYGKKKMGALEIREDRSVVLADQELIRGWAVNAGGRGPGEGGRRVEVRSRRGRGRIGMPQQGGIGGKSRAAPGADRRHPGRRRPHRRQPDA